MLRFSSVRAFATMANAWRMICAHTATHAVFMHTQQRMEDDLRTHVHGKIQFVFLWHVAFRAHDAWCEGALCSMPLPLYRACTAAEKS